MNGNHTTKIIIIYNNLLIYFISYSRRSISRDQVAPRRIDSYLRGAIVGKPITNEPVPWVASQTPKLLRTAPLRHRRISS